MTPEALRATGELAATLTAEQLAEAGRLRSAGGLAGTMAAGVIEASEDLKRRLLDLGPGLHENVSEAVYHSRILGMASKSSLDVLRRSPAHYWAWAHGQLDDEGERKPFQLGKAVHCAVCEPTRFVLEYVLEPEYGDLRYTGAKEKRAAFRKEHEGAMLLSGEHGRHTMGMVRAIAAHPLAARLFGGDGPSEVVARWDDPTTGIACKARLDKLRTDLGVVVDLKSTKDARPDAFRSSCWNYGYDHQADWYTRGMRALGQETRFVFVAVESAPPYPVQLVTLDAGEWARGRAKRDEPSNAELLETLARCIEKDEWPGYGEGIQEIGVPPWAR